MSSRFMPLLVGALVLANGGCDSPADAGPVQARYDHIVAGGYHTCARSVTGTWYCWGHALGYRATRDASAARARDWSRPALLSNDPGLVTLSTGAGFTCGLTAAGEAYCWGHNSAGQLGRGFLSLGGEEFRIPAPVETDIRFSVLAGAGTAAHMCALSGGRAYCWGNNFRKQLGAGIEEWEHPFVEPVLGAHTFETIATGEAATCALTQSSDVYCWGALVPGRENDLEQPTLIAAATGFDTLVARHGVRCGLRSGGAYCHGINTTGGLGTGDTLPHEGFVEVAGGHRFRQLSGGRVHICGVTFDDEAYCWGYGAFGRLGNGSDQTSLVPVPVGGGHRFAMVTAGGEHTCGLTTAGEVYCWGYGAGGQIGNGRTEDRWLPARIAEPIEP